ncbi:hypothetical protein GRJ2_002925000 [Grus japonensis]|uniref:Rna-directed dna polymerase from mobile element jockey-like n=1 Tax=Grus japonensis TaxID=30415 RepID=A0ABC9Y4Y6_GRUJA
MPAGSKTDPPLAKAEPISDSGCVFARKCRNLDFIVKECPGSLMPVPAIDAQSREKDHRSAREHRKCNTEEFQPVSQLHPGLKFNATVQAQWIECTLSKFADSTKLCGAVDTLEGRDAIQRDLDRLEEWAHANSLKFSKAKYKVLHTCCGNPKHKNRPGGEWIESNPEEKDFVVLVDEKVNMSWQYALAAQEADQLYPGLHQKERDWQVKRCDSAPLLHSCETPPGVLHPALEAPVQERHGAVGECPEEDHKVDHLSYEDRLRELVLFSLEKRKLWGDLIPAFRGLKGTHKKSGERLFTRACSDRTRGNGFKLKEGRFR